MMNLYVDMDGVLAEYRLVPLSALYEPGYFTKLLPQENVVEGLKTFIENHPEINVCVLSCLLSDRPHAEEEKREWLKVNCPFLKDCNKLFIPCGTSKRLAVSDGDNFLLDDHSPNIIDFDDGHSCHGIKLINGVNGKGIKWHGETLSSSLSPDDFARSLFNSMKKLKSA